MDDYQEFCSEIAPLEQELNEIETGPSPILQRWAWETLKTDAPSVNEPGRFREIIHV